MLTIKLTANMDISSSLETIIFLERVGATSHYDDSADSLQKEKNLRSYNGVAGSTM